ncbi:carbon-nitrogen hydrolase family protein [Microbulbifer yueqingensis]|uniref:Carbon-nitrogen hydrolase n=1 Tax=Microbulbifer yueqingensis TaxID=658219 RepID=A0A1G9E287_9GAMM|nr:carbon-nitrogen hydrolase family protein [Microbulbifer yueqingensis]SDK70223.1 Carbon-nitrogen hydrolase [Microbulbifer yueqingensis]
MIKKLLLLALTGLLLLLLVVSLLAQVPPASFSPVPREGEALPAGEPALVLEPLNAPVAGAANLVSVQPWLQPLDYASGERLYRKLETYLARAEAEGWLGPRTLVVLPEHIGTWLVASGEGFLTYRASSTSGAMLWAALGNLPAFSSGLYREVARGETSDPLAAALFRLKARSMANEYQRVFSRLAQRFGVTLVAGSILLPDPQLAGGSIHAGTGPLYNSSFVFYADGRIAGPVRKVYPIASELPFTRPARQPLPVFETPLGKLGVLICADSWYPDTWAQLAGADLVVVPSFATPTGIWTRPWQGYNGAAAPRDVDPGDVGRISEGEAWRKYALGGRGGQVRAGINTFLRGELWDLGDDGRTTAVIEGKLLQGVRRDGAVISSLWLPESQ